MRYTTTLNSFHLLPQHRTLHAPSLFYSARNPAGRWLSRQATSVYASRHACNADLPLLRLGLHPADAQFPQLVRHFQNLLRELLHNRVPMTKAAFAERQMAAVPDGLAADKPPASIMARHGDMVR